MLKQPFNKSTLNIKSQLAIGARAAGIQQLNGPK